MSAQRMSPEGIEFLIREEGLVPHAYNDSAGHATFGVGHLLHHGRVTLRDRLKWNVGFRTKRIARAKRIFAKDLRKYEEAVRDAVSREVSQHQFDAMVSLCFNIGTGGFVKSTVARESRARHPSKAADAFMMWDNPPELRPRRERERRLFNTGKYN